jgi:SAM-dependent methyltransferase
MPWERFEQVAGTYEAWYATRRGERADRAERALLRQLLQFFPGARRVLEVGCGTGHFTAWLATQGLQTVGLDRAPGMLAEFRRRRPQLPVICADAHRLPVRAGAVDLVVFVTTLEFLEDPEAALTEAVRVARQGLVLLVLNRWSLGGISRRWGAQARGALLSQARDLSVRGLQASVQRAAAQRLRELRWTSTLFPAGLWWLRLPFPVGDVIGMAARLAPPATRATVVQLRTTRVAS